MSSIVSIQSYLQKACRAVLGWGCCLALAACSESDEVGEPTQVLLEPGMVYVPSGEFVMGSDKTDEKGLQKEFGFVKPLYVDEHPEHKVYLEGYQIDKYEVSNADYKEFVVKTRYQEPLEWIQNGYNVRWEILERSSAERLRTVAREYFRLDRDINQMGKEDLLNELAKMQRQRDAFPVTGISWYDAYSYCQWRGKRLPSEAEWEKAARGEHGQEYPWGQRWDLSKTNTGEGEAQELTLMPIGSVSGDVSPYGARDMAGNVSEWVDDWYEPYPGSSFESEAFGAIHKVVRGGGAGVGHYAISTFFRAARRGHADPSALSTDVGFRCAKD